MTISKSIVQVFSRNKTQPEAEPETESLSISDDPPQRTVINAPLIQEGDASIDRVLIKALPSSDNSECRLMVNRPLFADSSWYFSSRTATRGSPLAEVVFAVDEKIATLLVHGSILTMTAQDHISDWHPLAQLVGAALRNHLESGMPSISDEVLALLPDEDTLRQKVQAVIDEEINPGVSGHGGFIKIVNIQGNAVTISMGGGCQGCSSAAMTLKGGIEQSFRNNVPEIGAILDATDHTAGNNPYFS